MPRRIDGLQAADDEHRGKSRRGEYEPCQNGKKEKAKNTNTRQRRLSHGPIRGEKKARKPNKSEPYLRCRSLWRCPIFHRVPYRRFTHPFPNSVFVPPERPFVNHRKTHRVVNERRCSRVFQLHSPTLPARTDKPSPRRFPAPADREVQLVMSLLRELTRCHGDATETHRSHDAKKERN